MSKGYMPICNLLRLLVWPCIGNRQQYRIRGLLIYMQIFNNFSFNFKSHFSVSLTRGLALKFIFSLVKTRFAGYKKVKLVKCPISRHILATNLKVHRNDDFSMFCHLPLNMLLCSIVGYIVEQIQALKQPLKPLNSVKIDILIKAQEWDMKRVLRHFVSHH